MNPRILVPAIAMLCAVGMQGAKPKKGVPIYKDATAPIEKRVDDLLARMTTEEKIWQVNQYTLGLNNNENNVGEARTLPAEIGSVIYFDQDPQLRNALQRRAMEESRLGIPVIFGYDVIHGFRTVYPIPLAQSCSWNPELAAACSRVAARESRASGVDWTFSPMLDVAHDPRWGRVSEGYGEDPYATSVFADATVRAYQGNDLRDPHNVAACLKHYVGYGASEAGRDYVYSEISRSTLWNTYLLPFEAGIKAGARTVMSGFNDISGVPATCNHYTLTEVLKEKWGFGGFVVSDWTAVEQLVLQGVAADNKESAEKAFNAGVDMDIIDNCYKDHLESLIKEKKVSMQRLDDAVRRILHLKFELGLFENPYTPETPREERVLLPQYRETAEKMAEETMVLLKNDNGILPLKGVKTIALIGPMIHDGENLIGWWWGQGIGEDVCTIADAMQKEFGSDVRLLCAQGCDVEGHATDDYAQALDYARTADVTVLCLGEKRRWSGENAPWASISLPHGQEALLDSLSRVGRPVVVALANGRPLDLSRIEPKATAIVEMWQPGIPGGTPLAAVLSGKVNPSGRLSISFPRSAAQIPVYYNQRPPARRNSLGYYLDMPVTPLYAFGDGLSYTTYGYGEITAPKLSLAMDDSLTVSIDVTNTGSRDGKETVLWYVNDPVATISRPMKELKHFEKREIKAGGKETFTFTIVPRRDLSYRDEQGDIVLEPGDFHIFVKDKKLTINLHK